MSYKSNSLVRVRLVCLTACLLSAPAVQAQSAADCAAQADRASRNSGSVVGGAASGAVGGAIFGAIVGDTSKSARRGAALGGVVGGARNAIHQDEIYKRVYDDCMYRR